MSKIVTSPAVSPKVISDAKEKELLALFHSLHTKVRECLTEVAVAPKFNDTFEKCNNEDYKALHEQSRILLRAKEKARWDSYIGAIETKVNVVINAYMVRARATKAQLDALRANTPEDMRAFLPAFPNVVKIPVSDLVGCWKEGTAEGRLIDELNRLFPRSVGKGKDDKQFLTVAFTAEEPVAQAPTSEDKGEEKAETEETTDKEESAPVSETKDLAAAAE